MTFLTKSLGPFLIRHWPTTLLALAVVVVLATPHMLERMFVYFPTAHVDADPRAAGLDFRDLALVTEDGVRLDGWFVPRAGARVTLLALHGNAGNIGHRVPWIEMLHRAGAHVLILDYRGYGRSQGKPFEEGLYRDARAAYAWWARERTGDRLVLIGESLGGAVATELALRQPVAGIILQSTFTSVREMARTMLPIGLLAPLARVRFDSAARIGLIACPKLVIHGDRDGIVPFRMGERLFDLAREPKEFYRVAGADHNDLPWVAGEEYVRRIARFLASL